MMMTKEIKKVALFAIMLMASCGKVYAQQYSIKGLIIDSCGVPIPSAGVALYSLSNYSLSASAACDSLGKYNIKVDKGQYAIGFSGVGYESQMYSIQVDSNMNIGKIVLKSVSVALDEIEVTAKPSPFKLSGQTMLVDVENDNILSHQNNVYEILGKVPGIIKFSNSINVGGKGSPIYYVNGRKVLNQSEIDNLQVDNVKSLKVVFNSDGTYDAGGAPVVDITTKRMGDGLAVNASSQAEQSKYLSLKDGFSASYNTGKWDFFLDYYYGHSKSSTRQHNETELTNQSVWNKYQRYKSLSMGNTHYYHVGSTYHLSDKAQIGLRYTGNYAMNSGNSFDSLSITTDKELSSAIRTDKNDHSNSSNHHINAFYDAELQHSWNVNASADYIHSESEDRSNFIETGSEADSYRYNGGANWNVFAANIHLSHTFGKHGTLRFGYDFSHTQGTDGIVYGRAQHNGNTKNRETRNAVFANYELPFGNFTFNAGLRYENVQSKLRETYLSSVTRNHYNKILPSVSLSQSSGFFMQSLGYFMTTNRPVYSDMNDNEIYSNRYALSRGNLNLHTEINHGFSYMLMYKYLLFTLNYSYYHHPLMNYFYGDDKDTPTEVATMTNFSHKQELSSMINYRPIIKCWTPSLSLVMMKTFIHYPGPDNTTYHDGNPLFTLSFFNDWELPKNFILSAGYQQTFGGYLQMIKVKPFSTFDIVLKKSFFNDRLRISLNASDIFNGDRNKTTVRMNNLWYNMHTKYDTRKFGITITYRFRNVKEKNTSNAAKDEMRRLNIEER